MAASKILLVLGAGKNIGQSLANGFKAAVDGQITPKGFLTIKGDLKNPASIPTIFETVKSKLGGPPTTVVYNAMAVSMPTDPTNPFTTPMESFKGDFTVSNTSAYIAAREAVAGFEAADESALKAFIYTGNFLVAVTVPIAQYITLGVGKSAVSYWVGAASSIYKEKGYRFHFADERTPEGGPITRLKELSGPSAAEFYLELVEGNKDIPWFATFITGKGFVDFPRTRRLKPY